METRLNGTRFINYHKWEIVKQQPYDYAREGFLNKIMSNAIVNTKNPALRQVLQYIENSFIFVMKYIDILKNFKNIHYSNR